MPRPEFNYLSYSYWFEFAALVLALTACKFCSRFLRSSNLCCLFRCFIWRWYELSSCTVYRYCSWKTSDRWILSLANEWISHAINVRTKSSSSIWIVNLLILRTKHIPSLSLFFITQYFLSRFVLITLRIPVDRFWSRYQLITCLSDFSRFITYILVLFYMYSVTFDWSNDRFASKIECKIK